MAYMLGIDSENYGAIGILEIAATSQAICERIYCKNGGKVVPVLEHLHYVCYYTNSVYMALQGYALFQDEFYIKYGRLYSPRIEYAWGSNLKADLRKIAVLPAANVRFPGQPNEFQARLIRAVSNHVYTQDIETVRNHVLYSPPVLKALMREKNPLYSESDEERELGIRVTRTNMRQWMRGIYQECVSVEEIGAGELRRAFVNSGFGNGKSELGASVATEIIRGSAVSDGELQEELQKCPRRSMPDSIFRSTQKSNFR